MQSTKLQKRALSALLFGLTCATALAGNYKNNFDSDPAADPNAKIIISGNGASWQPSGGNPATGGFLRITPASGSQFGAILFNDIDNGAVIAGFTFECDVRIGNGSSTPADGFSLNYVRNTDPVLVQALANGGVIAQSYGFSDNGDGGDASLPEEGCQTGISIGFDAWDSGTIINPPRAPAVGLTAPGITHDYPGIDIRVDNLLVKIVRMPTLNGSVTDPTSLQTGPNDGSNSETGLGWAHLKVDLSTNAVLNVWYKNTLVLSNYQTQFFPSPGRLIFAGRTGGASEIQDVDNVSLITIAAAKPLVVIGSASGTLTGFSVNVYDAPPSIADTNTIALNLNGAAVKATSVTKSNDVTTIAYSGASFLPSGSTNTVSVSIKDTQSPANTISGDRQFVAATYATLPESLALAAGQVDTGKKGFIWDMSQVDSVGSDSQNSTKRTLDQIAGLLGPNTADPNAQGVALGPGKPGATANDPIRFEIPDVLAVDRNGATWSGWGTQAAGDQMPGSPGTGGGTDNQAARIITYIDLPVGLVTMGVNSDDGFLTEAGAWNDAFTPLIWLGEFNGGRGAADSTFTFLVTKAGIYPFVSYWENGGGDSRIAWFTVKTDGTKIALNDTANGGFKCYRALVGGAKAGALSVAPAPNATAALPNKIAVQLADGANPIDKATVSLKLDNATVAATVTKSGSVTTVAYTPSPLLAPLSTHTAALLYTEGGTQVTRQWQFTVANYPTTPPKIAKVSVLGGVFQETKGVVVVEAVHFVQRTSQAGGPHRYVIVPDEDPGINVENGGVPFANSRTGHYVQNIPSGDQNRNGGGLDVVNSPPYLDFKIQINTPGDYQLYIRPGSANGSSNSGYVQILELQKSVGGPGPDWYRFNAQPETAADFSRILLNADDANSGNIGWMGYAGLEVQNGGGGDVPAVWTISKAGTYTLRWSQREAGAAVDAFILQLKTLPAPTSPGPAESVLASGPTALLLAFSAPLDSASAQAASNYSLSGGAQVSSAVLGPSGTTVLLAIAGPLTINQQYTLTMGGVKDLYGNTIAAGTATTFSASLVAPPAPVAGPKLSVSRSGANVVISWPTADGAGFTLQQAGSLSAPISWSPVTQTPATSGANSTVTVPITAGNQFFQLKK